MKGVIVNFRQGRHHQTDNQMVIKADGVSKLEDAKKLVGKAVTFKTQTGKEIKGKITAAHGNSGAVRVHFEKGMPGQSLAESVDIQ